MLHRNSAPGGLKLPFQAHLSDCRVQVVHDHQHDGGSLRRTARVLMDGVSPGGREGEGFLSPHRQQELLNPPPPLPQRHIWRGPSHLMGSVGQKRYM